MIEDDDEHDVTDERNAEIIDNLLEAGYSEGDIEVRDDVILVDGQLEDGRFVFVEGDIHVTLAASQELLGESFEDGESFRHWRTPGVVSNGSAMICLARVNNAQAPYDSYELTDAMRTGVSFARDNLNNLSGFGLSFKMGDASVSSSGVFSNSISGCNHVIYIYQVAGGAGGSAGFPSGGAPYSQVRMNSGLAGYSNNAHEHVALHEIGHAIGLRHTDWLTRSSCGQNTNEGQSGAVQIPGTPYQTTNSVMAACFSASTDGEFRGDDALALTTLYPENCGASTSQVPVMTSASAPSGNVTRSGVISGSYEAWKAFDAVNSMWISEVWVSPAWLSYEWDDGDRFIDRYEIHFSNGASLATRAPRDWVLQGWNGSGWTTVDTRTNQTGWGGVEIRSFNVANPGSYSRYRLYVTQDNDNRADVVTVSINRLMLFGCQ